MLSECHSRKLCKNIRKERAGNCKPNKENTLTLVDKIISLVEVCYKSGKGECDRYNKRCIYRRRNLLKSHLTVMYNRHNNQENHVYDAKQAYREL